MTTEGAPIWKFYINTNIILILIQIHFVFCLIAAAMYAVIVRSAKINETQQIKEKLVSVSDKGYHSICQ